MNTLFSQKNATVNATYLLTYATVLYSCHDKMSAAYIRTRQSSAPNSRDTTLSRPGTVVSRRWTSSSSRVGASKASAFRFVSRAVCSLYSTLNLRRPSFSSRCPSDLEQSSTARHIHAVTFRLLHSLEDILLRTVLFIKFLLCLRSNIVILETLIVLLTYLITETQ